ncbi:RNA polymerase sigma factor RpoD/SigA [Mucilaginibacter sp. ZT4R22]|uniref:RNA polymerase sigma factor RpoD/SigA n=1 Tax=Mucilaginibacter pankratovii TaxID=2772110 RepID=A0ABR7WSZ6_9SPHI|nr:RNA polymerase sigma factor RpoD/SigA [Mucilaginibacter pankratovii]MBD1365415.1 RNA polymerase sigma factor RpoD/SigA [Mucilaginibacter pankratovii]
MREFVVKTTLTQRDDRSLDLYFNEVEKIRRIEITEEEALFKRIEQGDRQALRQLIVSNLRFVISVAKQYQTQSISLNDLINEGNLGMIRAARSFDPKKGFRFISYAVWWIRQAISTAVQEQKRFIHLPLNQLTMLNQYARTAAKMEQQMNRKPTCEEVALELGVDVQKMEELLSNAELTTSIDHPVSGGSTTVLRELLPDDSRPPDEVLIKESVIFEVNRALNILGKREREIVMLFFGLSSFIPHRLEEIAGKLCLSVEHTRRLKDQALDKLRSSTHAPSLKSCFS